MSEACVRDKAGAARRTRMAACVLVAGVMLASCSTLGIGGKSKKGDDANAPPEEKRISVLALDNTLRPDPKFATVVVDVPPGYRNFSWPQPGGEADHTLHNLSGPTDFNVAWRADIGFASSRRARLTSPPVVADGRVYVLDAEAKVTAYDAESGDRDWRTQLTPKIEDNRSFVGKLNLFTGTKPGEIGFGGGVAYDDGKLFVASGFGFVAALDASTGKELWRHKTDAPIRTAPTAYQGNVYVTTDTNQLLALSEADGERQWDFQSFEESARILSDASPAISGDLIVAPFSSGEVVAFRAQNGSQVWSQTLSRTSRLTALSMLNDIAGSPVIDRGLVYVVSHAGRFVAIDIRTGERLWENTISGLQMPWVAGDYIYLVSVDGELVCVSRADGAIVWVKQLRHYKKEKKKKGRITWAGPVMVGDALVLVSSMGEIVRASPQNGDILSEKSIGGGSFVSPVVANEMIYVLTEDGKLVALK